MEASNQNLDRIRHIYEYLTPKCVAVSAIDLGTNGVGNCHPFYFFNKINFSFICLYIYIYILRVTCIVILLVLT
jgi:hypothetical protein